MLCFHASQTTAKTALKFGCLCICSLFAKFPSTFKTNKGKLCKRLCRNYKFVVLEK